VGLRGRGVLLHARLWPAVCAGGEGLLWTRFLLSPMSLSPSNPTSVGYVREKVWWMRALLVLGLWNSRGGEKEDMEEQALEPPPSSLLDYFQTLTLSFFFRAAAPTFVLGTFRQGIGRKRAWASEGRMLWGPVRLQRGGLRGRKGLVLRPPRIFFWFPRVKCVLLSRTCVSKSTSVEKCWTVHVVESE
jgi:hypothetical protein